MLVKDVVDLLWEVRRLRRWKAQVLASARREALEKVLRRLIIPGEKSGLIDDRKDAQTLAQRWIEGDEEAVNYVQYALEKTGLARMSSWRKLFWILCRTFRPLSA